MVPTVTLSQLFSNPDLLSAVQKPVTQLEECNFLLAMAATDLTQHEISLRVAKPVRLYIHRVLDSGRCLGLSHESFGERQKRCLILKKETFGISHCNSVATGFTRNHQFLNV